MITISAMQREDEKDEKGKKTSGDRDGPAMAIGDVTSQKTDSLSSDNNSPSSEISSEAPPATAVVQDAEHSASESPQQLPSGPRTDPESGEDVMGSNVSNLKKNLNLDLKSTVSSPPRLPIISLGDETCPLMATDQPSVRPMNIPSLAIDSSRCILSSVSTSEESLQDKKVYDTLDVNFSPGKRKTRSSPIHEYDSDDSGNSESNPGSSEKPRQKKSIVSRIMSREKSPLRKKEKGLETKTDKSVTDSRSKRGKSPTHVRKNKSPKGSQTKLDKSPTRSPGKRAKSPSKIISAVKNFFGKKDEESKLLVETDSGETEDGSKKPTKKEKGKDISKLGDLPVTGDRWRIVGDVNFSDTTCDSTSTKFSRASISTDSPTSDAGNETRTNVPDRTPTNPKQKTETSSSDSDDNKMDEN